MLAVDPDRRLRLLARSLALVPLVVAVVALAGWVFDVPVLRRPLDDVTPISPAGGFGLGLLALSAVLHTTRLTTTAARGAAVIAGGIGFVELVGRVAGDSDPVNAGVFGVTDARLPVAAGLAFSLFGLAFFVITTGSAGRRVARLLAAGAAALGFSALVGYALGVGFFYGADASVQLAPHSALGLVLLAISTAALAPGPLVRVLLGSSLGGRFLRTSLPLIFVIQVAGAVLATAGARSDLLSPETAVWVMTITALACVAVLGARVALQLHRYDERLRDDARRLAVLAARDPLTGGLNRRVFDQEVERAADHLRRYGGTGAVCVIDLDHFKEINDTYGHNAGDDALVRVYRALRSRLRSTDVLGRIGGDEFAALLPLADELTAVRVSGELREVVDQVARELSAEGRPSRLSASVGFALLTGDDSAADVLDLADQRMYAAKRAARAA